MTSCLKTHYKNEFPEVGIDEAGRGPLWGPMMACAIILPDEDNWTDNDRELVGMIKDSKKISSKKRDILSAKIKDFAIGYGLGQVTAEEIDEWGATRANQTAFRRAIEDLYTKVDFPSGVLLVIDGVLPLSSLGDGESQETIVDGDANYLHIAAASILAKVEHDTWVINWCKNHVAEAEKYDLLNCKGYGTQKHRDGILKYGYIETHRRLYLRKLIPDITVSRCKIVI